MLHPLFFAPWRAGEALESENLEELEACFGFGFIPYLVRVSG